MTISAAFEDAVDEAKSQGLSYPEECFCFAYAVIAEECINRAEGWARAMGTEEDGRDPPEAGDA